MSFVLIHTICKRFAPAIAPSTRRGVHCQATGSTENSVCKTAQERLMAETATLYVHWPYCEKRCTYCNFNKYISNSVDEGRMERCLKKEAETLITMSGVKRIGSVFFGGGTPSLAPASTLNSVLETISKHAYLPKDAEVTIEVNPTRAASPKLRDFRHAGVNRISIGVQTLNDKDLQTLGRDHTAEDAVRCIELGKQLFPGRLSVDMIFGRPSQTVQRWIDELHQILPLLGGHISLYQLTLERGTKLFKQVGRGKYSLPDEDSLLEMYTSAVQILQNHGLFRYEVSNFASHGCESFHNKNYWEGGQYIGVGPGAHGRFMPQGETIRQARIQTLEPDSWMYEVEHKGHATRKAVPLNRLNILEELLMTGLRTTEGIPHQHWTSVSQGSSNLWDLCQVCTGVQDLFTAELLMLDSLGLRATSQGLLILDSLLPLLVSCLQDYYSGHEREKE